VYTSCYTFHCSRRDDSPCQARVPRPLARVRVRVRVTVRAIGLGLWLGLASVTLALGLGLELGIIKAMALKRGEHIT